MRWNLFAWMLVTASAVVGPAAAGPGTAVGVDRNAILQAANSERVLVVGDDLAIGDRVVTDGKGLVQIQFSDNTRLVVGPNSSLVIEDYLLREDGSAGNFVVSALTGTFRFATGIGAKEKYRIQVPTGTIGIRGTKFDFQVSGTTASVLAYEGEVHICTRGAACATLSTHCDIGQLEPDESFVVDTKREKRSARKLKETFPLAASQSGLFEPFRISGASGCLGSEPATAIGSIVGNSVAPVRLPTAAAPEPAPGGGESSDCAGNSSPNPGNSQNCTGK